MAKKYNKEEIVETINGTRIIKETYKNILLHGYMDLFFNVIGKTPFRDDMCISRKGKVTISPQLFLSPPKDYNLEELLGVEIPQIEARVLFFHNHKLEFNEKPVQRYEGDLEEVIEKVSGLMDEQRNWVLLHTPNTQLWRISLFHYLYSKAFKKGNLNKDNDLLNRFGFGGLSLN